MSTYDNKKAALQRTPIDLLVLRLDFCGLSFGQSPCTATGEPCFNTFATCKDRANYDRQTKDYEFCSQDAPLPFPGPRPYLARVKDLPTEIKDTLALTGRMSLTLADEPETTDVGLDPYADQRSSVAPGTFWRKLLARNPNHIGRPATLYRGFLGMTRAEFLAQPRWSGDIDTIKVKGADATVTLVDPLKSISGIKTPPEIEVSLVTELKFDHTAATLQGADLDKLPDSGWLRIEDEICSYTLNRTTNVATLTRAAHGTTAEDHSEDTSVNLAIHIPPTNPFDLVQQLLTNGQDPRYNLPPGAGIDPAKLDPAAFTYWRDWPGGEPGFEILIDESTGIEDLLVELLDILDAGIWYSENQLITIRRNIPNEPGRSLIDLTDAGHIVHNSSAFDGNEEAVKTRVVLFWEKRPIEDADKRLSYRRSDIAVDLDAEGPNGLNTSREKPLAGRFLSTANQQAEPVQTYAAAVVNRRLLRIRDANPVLTLQVELKDADILTGQAVTVSTDELTNPDGSPVERAVGVVKKRQDRGDTAELTIELYRGPTFAFIAPDTAPDYDAANLEDREYAYISDDQGHIGTADGYAIY